MAARGLVNGGDPLRSSGGDERSEVSADNSSATQAPEEKVEEKKVRRTKKSGTSLSLSALMSEDEPEVMPATEEAVTEKPLPGDDELAAALEAYSDMIGRTTLATSMARGTAPEGFVSQKWDINGKKAELGIAKA